jgi:hypothetical protein
MHRLIVGNRRTWLTILGVVILLLAVSASPCIAGLVWSG